MKRSWIGPFLVTVIALFHHGCVDACTGASDRLTSRYKECEINVAEPEEPEGSTVCTDAAADRFECLADCADSASCEALTGKDTQGAVDFGRCNAECPQ
jgi:hypothetical protein